MFLAQILGIPDFELRCINKLLEVIDDHQFGYTVRARLADLPLSQINSNTLVETIFYRINEKIFHQIKQQIENDRITVSNEAEKEQLLSQCEARITHFSPYSTEEDASFNNELDESPIIGNTLSEIVDEVIPHFLKNVKLTHTKRAE